MKSFIPSKGGSSGKTVGEIIDAMYRSGEFDSITIVQLTDMVHAFLREYVGMPGTIVTKKFNKEAAQEFSVRFGIPLEDVIKVVAVFRLKFAGKGKSVKSKIMKAYGRVRMKGGSKSGVKSRM